MSTIFSKILAGEIPCSKVWENDEFLAFLDIQPVRPGHTLVIPKQEVDYLFDMDKELYGRLMEASRIVAIALKEATGCKRVSVGVFGFEVRHTHIHLIPMDELAQFPFPDKLTVSPSELSELAEKIAQKLPIGT